MYIILKGLDIVHCKKVVWQDWKLSFYLPLALGLQSRVSVIKFWPCKINRIWTWYCLITFQAICPDVTNRQYKQYLYSYYLEETHSCAHVLLVWVWIVICINDCCPHPLWIEVTNMRIISKPHISSFFILTLWSIIFQNYMVVCNICTHKQFVLVYQLQLQNQLPVMILTSAEGSTNILFKNLNPYTCKIRNVFVERAAPKPKCIWVFSC